MYVWVCVGVWCVGVYVCVYGEWVGGCDGCGGLVKLSWGWAGEWWRLQ